jgi:deazaflavin-dependent oxidoreductase (nitroreductase family)
VSGASLALAGHIESVLGDAIEHVRKLARVERIGNLIATVLLKAGVGPNRLWLVTVVGRNTGKPYTTALAVVETDGHRWLVAPYRGVSWVKNLRASGTAVLSRGRVKVQVTVEPLDAHESAPVLKAYVGIEPGTRRAFKVGPDASLEEFEAIAPNHPVFRVRPVNSPPYGRA